MHRRIHRIDLKFSNQEVPRQQSRIEIAVIVYPVTGTLIWKPVHSPHDLLAQATSYFRVVRMLRILENRTNLPSRRHVHWLPSLTSSETVPLRILVLRPSGLRRTTTHETRNCSSSDVSPKSMSRPSCSGHTLSSIILGSARS